MKIFKTILCIIFSIEVLLAITMFLVNNDVMYVVIGIIFAFLAFWSFKSSRKHKKKGHQNNDESFDIDSAIKTLSNEIASSIQFSVPELTEQQQRDLEKVKEMQEASPNPKYRRTPREEDLSFDFEEKWGSQIHFLEAEMQKKYSAATQAQD